MQNFLFIHEKLKMFLCFQAEGNQNRLQEEFQRMMFQLEEERKVTANMSRSLELEKRKVSSWIFSHKCPT